MGETAKKFMNGKGERRRDLPREDSLPPQEQKALKTLQKEAKQKGTDLLSDGKGGLPPSLVLGVLRRDDYKCKQCNSRKNITLHHKGGIVASKWLSKQGHKNNPQNIATICQDCHDKDHEKARAKGIDSSQVTPEGDKGTRRDKGLPNA